MRDLPEEFPSVGVNAESETGGHGDELVDAVIFDKDGGYIAGDVVKAGGFPDEFPGVFIEGDNGGV